MPDLISKASTKAVLGITGEALGTTDVQVETNKTIDAKNNTFINIAQLPTFGRKTGSYVTGGDIVQGTGLLEDIQAYGILTVSNDANAFWHAFATGTPTNTTAGVVKMRTGGVVKRSFNPMLRFKLFVYPKSSGDSRGYLGFYAPTGLITTSDTPISTSQSGFLFGWRSTDTNFQIFNNNGGGGAELVTDTGIALPGGITLYRLELSGNSSNMIWTLYDSAGSQLGTGTISSQLPATTTTMNVHGITQNPTGVSKNITFVGADLEMDK